MKLSIILITYNQEHYIRQCLDSVWMQQPTGMPTELIVADDASTDGSMAVIREYARQTSFDVIFLPDDTNHGFVKNYERAFAACTGDYIAIIEGDDYWIDPARLLKHIRFFESHPACVMTMNRFIELNQNNDSFALTAWNNQGHHQLLTTAQLATGNKLGNLSACMFRKTAIDKIKPDLFNLEISDWMLGMVLGEWGEVAILREAMSVYRVHNKGQWSKMTVQQQTEITLRIIDEYNSYLGNRYHNEFNSCRNKLTQPAPVPPSTPFIKRLIKSVTPPVLLQMIKGK